ncbi:hypothetical protein CEXT_285551 [Caerostris extrusa]|uniref:Uncharacterized protein n=1 Tax=Caerostris extrusa TaxID=172846 RepID=A0AAV4Y2K7_CAEEX|nr:hypothetical protein CEXT_285551 [Caerostris extrusa]
MPMLFPTRYIPAESVTYLRTVICIGVQILIGSECSRLLADSTLPIDGIRNHASEETGALNQPLRPLGHASADNDKTN